MKYRRDFMDRFMQFVGSADDCWEWIGAKSWGGYGVFSMGGYSIPAHRFIYTVFVDIPTPGMTIDHLCRNRACVNPDHLEEVSYAENIRRGINAAVRVKNKTHCKHGHSLTAPANVYIRLGGARRCRTCARKASLKWFHTNERDLREVV